MNANKMLSTDIVSLALRQQIITSYTYLEKKVFLTYFKKIINTTSTVENKRLYFFLGIQTNYIEALFREDDISLSVKNKHKKKQDDNYFDSATLRTLLNLIRDGYSGIFDHSLAVEEKIGSGTIGLINTIEIVNNVRNKIAHDSVNGFMKEARRLTSYPIDILTATVTSELSAFKEVSFLEPNNQNVDEVIYLSLNVLFHLLIVIKFLEDESNY